MLTFDFDKYINEKMNERKNDAPVDEFFDFYELCKKVKDAFYKDWESRDNSKTTLEIQKRAIIGYQKEKDFFKNRIAELVRQIGMTECKFPEWYQNLTDAVYSENWGMAGLAEWFNPEFAQSSSAKIIGDRIYFMENGHMTLRKQTISRERKEQLIKAFLLLTPEERMDKSYYETYLLDGTRVTIFAEPMAKKDQASIIFRRYLIPDLTFEEQAKRGTIPYEAIPLFKAMVGIGFNVVFLGAVRTAKTTFLSTWQRYEDPSLEGVMVETDPEVPMDKILPGAPIVQLIADGDDLKKISKNLLRSDADYFILAEARDGIALDTAVRIAAKGTKRMKVTFHSRLPKHFPLEAATEIVKQTGGDLNLTMQMVASGFDYLFHFVQLSDKSQKRLKGIYQMSCDESGKISIECVCEYDHLTNAWRFNNVMSDEVKAYGVESNADAFYEMQGELFRLSAQEYVK
ncbi:MAG: ATPase [Bacillota bacterium]|nr:ATPase [Bacillota bacterium]